MTWTPTLLAAGRRDGPLARSGARPSRVRRRARTAWISENGDCGEVSRGLQKGCCSYLGRPTLADNSESVIGALNAVPQGQRFAKAAD
jgi:hypothetical protein